MGWRHAGTIVILLAALSVGACGGGGDGTTTTRPAETVDAVLTRAGAAMADAESLKFAIDHEGAPVVIAGGGGAEVTFDGANGRFAAPSSADAVIAVSAGSLRTEVGAVSIDGEIWMTDPLSGRWTRAPDAFRFDPARIFRADVGLAALLADGLTDARLVRPEPDAEGRYHVTARVAPDRVAELTSGLVNDVRDAEFWIDADTGRLTETRFAVPVDDGDTRWIMTLSDYGSDVSVERPDTG